MDNIFQSENPGTQVKQWLDDNGKWIAVTLGLAIVFTFGFQHYQKHKINTIVQASMMYDQYQQALIGENKDAVVASATVIKQDYPKTAYASSVALLEASRAAFDGRYADAQTELLWLQEHGKPFARPLAALRTAQIKFAQNDFPGALAALDDAHVSPSALEGAYVAGFEELRGDIAAAQGDRVQAGTHYASALELYEKQGFNNVLLEMKTETYRK